MPLMPILKIDTLNALQVRRISSEDILYKDEALIAINKPSGLLVHRSEIDRHETRFALQEVRDLIGQWVYPVHRLDKGTSGVLLFALSAELARMTSANLQEEDSRKTYLVIVRGYLPQSGRVDSPLKEPWDVYGDRDSDPNKPAQSALTHYQCLAQAEIPQRVDKYPVSRYSLASVGIETGRRHQIRRHLKSIAHPVIGDSTYGKGNHNRLFQELFGSYRMLLHARCLQLRHPVSHRPLTILAPLDATFQHVANSLGWSSALAQDLQNWYF
jgi:tRNA pseudouridine65 synthase